MKRFLCKIVQRMREILGAWHSEEEGEGNSNEGEAEPFDEEDESEDDEWSDKDL